MQIRSLGWEDPLEEDMATHSIFLPGESHGQRSLADYSSQGGTESDWSDLTHTRGSMGIASLSVLGSISRSGCNLDEIQDGLTIAEMAGNLGPFSPSCLSRASLSGWPFPAGEHDFLNSLTCQSITLIDTFNNTRTFEYSISNHSWTYMLL